MNIAEAYSHMDTLQFSAEERRNFRQPKLARLILDFSLPWIQLLLGCTLFVLYPNVWTWVIAVIIIAGGQHGLSMISHEAAHRLIWPTDKRINDTIGRYLFAGPVMLPFGVYRKRHLIHHRLVSLPGDTKDFYLRDLRGVHFYIEVLRSLCGIDYLLQALGAIRYQQGDEHEAMRMDLRTDRRALIVAQGVIFLAFLSVDPLHYGVPTYYFLLWLGPLTTVSFLFGKLRSVVEHQPSRMGNADGDTQYFLNTPGPLLRTVRASWLERLCLSKIHFHFHAEHHLWPWISYQYLPRIHARIWQGQQQHNTVMLEGNLLVREKSYSAALGKVFRGQ